MYPVLFSIGKFSISSYGVFLMLGVLLGIFLVWRLGRAWDLNEEKTLDLTLLTFLGGLFGARVYFAIANWQYFAVSPLNFILINKMPGLSFWGGFLGGWLTLFFLARRKHQDFWQLADIASVGLLGGLILAEMGCFLGSCNVGIPSKAFFAVTQVGSIAKRWPVQTVEAVLLSIALARIWSQATHFHQRGKIVSLTFIYIGLIKLGLLPFRQNQSEGIFPAILTLLGLVIFYRVTKQNPLTHLKLLGKFLVLFLTESEVRKEVVQKIGRSWYNQKTTIVWKLKNLKKFLKGRNVKFS